METLNDITTCSQVRAALGVSETELPDETILQPMYLTQLKEELYSISSSMLTDIEAAKLSQTPQSKRLVELTALYATLQVAYSLRGALHNFAPRMISDGKATMQRFIDPVKEVVEALRDDLISSRTRLQSAYDSYKGSTRSTGVTFTGLVGARNSYDPVTG